MSPPSYLVFLFAAVIVIIGSPYPRLVAQTGPKTSAEERIHPGDLIEIDELGGFDFDWRGRMNPEGNLDGFTKVADPIFARCLTPTELADSVRTAYAKTLREPKVIVRILDRSERPLAIIDGAIRQPMRLRIRRPLFLKELIVIAGGFTDKASGEIAILRPAFQSCDDEASATTTTKMRVSDILTGDPKYNISIFSGDIVTIQSVEYVYVIGGVNQPGKVEWREGATLSRLVAAAGGIADRGVAGKVSVYRRRSNETSVVEVDLDKVIEGTSEDIELHPRDIVDIPFKGSKRKNFPPVAEVDPARDRRSLPIRVVN